MNLLAIGTIFYLLDIVMLVFASFLLAYILSPIYEKLYKIGISRFVSAIITIFTSQALLITLAIYCIPKLYIQFVELFKFLESIYKFIIHRYSYFFDSNVENSLEDLFLSKGNVKKAIFLISAYGYDTMQIIFNFLAVMMMSFYMLRDWNLWRERFLNIIPERYKSTTNIVFQDIMHSLKLWIYGQMSVSLILFMFYFIALSYINMPFTLLLAFSFSILTIIPYIGDMFSSVILLSILSGYKPFISKFSIYAFVVLSIGFILENIFLIPSFIGKKAGIHPLFLLILFLIFGKILGLSGIILTLPLSVIFASIWRTGIIKRKWY